ncbi:hypothetical protein CVT24_004207 [Panaeolus cyanescens]|uniref:Uncharacterized protein n=1 Tax=Panaeolus cyanescens TaxID=181874 RepID=A0A409YT19_9AGAR|nr:hypothetical protein CVT24_004207 [Panaeolus cyanescens]
MSTSTSIDSTTSLATAVLTYNPLPIPVAVTEVMKTLSPFINSDNGLDGDINQSIKDIRERFVQAVRHMCLMVKHTTLSLTMLTSTLEIANTEPHPLSIANVLRLVAESFLAGNACATDAHEQYTILRTDVESQFDLLEQKFGEECIIDVSGSSNTMKSTLKDFRGTIVLHLKESEKVSLTTVDILTGINKLFRTFLEDDSFSLKDPLTKVPLFSLNMFPTWKGLRDRFNIFQSKLIGPMVTFKMGYVLDAFESTHEQDEDRKARMEKLPAVQIKLQGVDPILDAAGPSPQLPRPLELISAVIPKTSGACVIAFEQSDKSPQVSGTTGIRVVISIPVPQRGSGLTRVRINAIAEVQSSSPDSSTCVLDNKSTTVTQIVQDPIFAPTNCRPIFSTRQPSKSTLQWSLSRSLLRRLRWKSAPLLPTKLALSFDIEHNTRVNLQLNVVFTFHRGIFRTRSSHIVSTQVPVDTTSPASNPMATPPTNNTNTSVVVPTDTISECGSRSPGQISLVDKQSQDDSHLLSPEIGVIRA